jgi:putative ABC transport system permease protein
MWGRLISYFRAIVGRDRFEAEMDEELKSHIERYADDLERAGTLRPEALRKARLEFGQVSSIKEDCRQPVGLLLLERLMQDLRHAVRTLRVSTNWMAVAMLALAIGLTTATLSIFDALFLRPISFKAADRLAYVNVRSKDAAADSTWAMWRAWKESDIFEAFGGMLGWWTVVIRTDAGLMVRPSAEITAGTLELLGARPLRGRTFSEDDPRAGNVVIISEDLWTRGFGRENRAIGASIDVDGKPATIVGVLPRTFRFPSWDTEVWRPIAEGAIGPGTFNGPMVIVRFRSDVPSEETLRLATEIAHQVDRSTVGMEAVRDKLAGYTVPTNEERAMPAIAGGVSLVFLALCLNVAGLSLTRFNDRRRQFALSIALGAPRGRLVAQAFTQSALIGVIGATIGIVLAHQLIAGARAWLPQSFLETSLHPLLLDWDTLFVAIGLALVATVVSGLLPAVVATKLDAASSLRVVERGGTETRSARVLSRAFVVFELALACALLVPMLLLVRSFLNLTAIDRGLNPDSLSIVQVNFDSTRAADPSSRATAQTRATELVAALPGVERVSWSVGVPTMESGPHTGYVRRVNASGVYGGRQLAIGMSVASDFFDVYRIPLVAGRALRLEDDDRRVVIDERIAATFFLDASPIGQSLAFGEERLEVVGVVRSVQKQRPQYPPTLYWKYKPGDLPYATFTIRCTAACPSEAVIRHALLPIESSLRAGTVERLADRFDRDLVAPRVSATVAMLFAAVALVTAAGGLFSVLSYAVGRRRREFGIRAALGGSSRAIGRLVLRDALITTVLGLGLGSIAAWWLANMLTALQFGVTINDPRSWTAVVAILALATFAASWRPMRTAMRADPAVLLREE